MSGRAYTCPKFQFTWMLPGNFWYLSICLECYCQLSHWGEEWHHMYKIRSRFQNAKGPHHKFTLMGRSHGPERWWKWAVNCFSLNCLLHFVYCALLIKPSWSNLHKKGNWVSIYPRCYDTTAGFDTTVGLWAYILSFSNWLLPVTKLFRLKLCGDMLVINCANGFLHLCY